MQQASADAAQKKSAADALKQKVQQSLQDAQHLKEAGQLREAGAAAAKAERSAKYAARKFLGIFRALVLWARGREALLGQNCCIKANNL